MGRPFFAPPDMPADRAGLLRDAFAQTLKDPQFLAEATKLGLEVNLVGGAEVQKIVDSLYDTPPEVLQRVKRISNPQAAAAAAPSTSK